MYYGLPISLDFDGTLCTHEYPNIGRSIGAEKVLRRLVEEGVPLILNTMRGGKYLEDAVNWFKERDIPLAAVNANIFPLTWTDSPKIYAKFYIDDSALGCPLKQGLTGEMPYVDWEKVEQILFPE